MVIFSVTSDYFISDEINLEFSNMHLTSGVARSGFQGFKPGGTMERAENRMYDSMDQTALSGLSGVPGRGLKGLTAPFFSFFHYVSSLS